MKKPFYKFPLFQFIIKRKWWNPMRLIFGDFYASHDPMKLDIDVKDIKFIKND